MGPRSVERGNPGPMRSTRDEKPASMGPRSVERGNHAGSHAEVGGKLRFNGATLGRAWKRGYDSLTVAPL